MQNQLRRVTAMGVACAALVSAGCQSINFARQVAHYDRTLDTYSLSDTTQTEVATRRHADGRNATLVSAFFGLDDALPDRVADRVACEGAGGADGMPIIFSHEVDIATLEPGDIRVTRASGAIGEVRCLTLAPADDPGELRTALLAGDYGSAEDPPVSVEIVGNVLSRDNTVNFMGAHVRVTPLEDGPTLVWAEIVPEAQGLLGREATALPWGGGSTCPPGSLQIVRVTWNGGVTRPGGEPADDVERALYQVDVLGDDGQRSAVTPFALADTGDGDNNHLLCLDTTAPAFSVSFPAGHLTDPREDLNPDTSVVITPAAPGQP